MAGGVYRNASAVFFVAGVKFVQSGRATVRMIGMSNVQFHSVRRRGCGSCMLGRRGELGMTLIPARMHIDFDLSEAPDVQRSFPGFSFIILKTIKCKHP